MVDETGWVKQGTHLVGVLPQYCGAVGKRANCQVSVEVVVSDGWMAVPVVGRLYLPESWTQDRERCAAVGVPEEVKFATKPELAVEILRQARRDGVPPAPVLGDSHYGNDAAFRTAVRDELGMEFFLQVDGAGILRSGLRSSGSGVMSARESPRRNLGGVDPPNARKRVEDVLLDDRRRANPADPDRLA